MLVAQHDNSHVVDIIDNGCRRSSVGEEECGEGSSVEVQMVDLESDVKVHSAKVERCCRICHLSMDMTNNNLESGTHMELGCSCKDDLAAAHKHCAEAWFKIKGNK